jgi:hypothetical protein
LVLLRAAEDVLDRLRAFLRRGFFGFWARDLDHFTFKVFEESEQSLNVVHLTVDYREAVQLALLNDLLLRHFNPLLKHRCFGLAEFINECTLELCVNGLLIT